MVPVDKPHNFRVQAPTDAVTSAELFAQLDRILESSSFVSARRASHLLRYLVTAAVTCPLKLLSEYVIGIDVFRRDPATYSTVSDPIVRVQLGRLRTRLDGYYRDEGRQDPIRIRLPLRTYLPRIEPYSTGATLTLRLAFAPLDCANEAPALRFAAGLQDELRHRLHQQLGACFLGVAPPPGLNAATAAGASHVLECSIRSDRSKTRTNLRLLATGEGRTLWSQQVDLGMDFSIACQERLATLCCRAVEECKEASRRTVAHV